MGLQYGIKQARETLLKLIEDNPLERKVGYMYSEIGVITSEDVSFEHFKEINRWQNEFLKTIDLKNNLTDQQKEKELKRLANEIVFLCTDIIEINAKKDK